MTSATTAAEAIAFALDHLDAFEVSDFLADWRGGKDIKPWLDARSIDLMAGHGDWTAHERLKG